MCFDVIVWGLYQSKCYIIVVVRTKLIVLISNTISHIENVVFYEKSDGFDVIICNDCFAGKRIERSEQISISHR